MRSVAPAESSAVLSVCSPAGSMSPCSSKRISTMSGVEAMSSPVLGLDGLQGAHQIDEAGPLERRFASQCYRGVEENLPDALRTCDEFLPHGQKGGDRTGHMRSSETGARLVCVRSDVGIDCVGTGRLARRGDAFAGSEDVRFEPAVPGGTLR